MLNAFGGGTIERTKPADRYREKWERESNRAIAAAVVAGEPADEAIDRIHRRWHRSVPVEDLRRKWRKAEEYAARRRKVEEMREAMRPMADAAHARLSAMSDVAGFVGPNGEIPGLDGHPLPYWRNSGARQGTADL